MTSKPLIEILVLTCLGASLLACREKPKYPVLNPSSSDPVLRVEDSDPAINQATQKAKDTLDEFIRALRKHDSEAYFVKTPIPNSDGDEHIWVMVDSYKDDTFHGKIDSEPFKLPGMKLGDKIEVKKSNISDWMIIDKGKIAAGGYTSAVLEEDRFRALQQNRRP